MGIQLLTMAWLRCSPRRTHLTRHWLMIFDALCHIVQKVSLWVFIIPINIELLGDKVKWFRLRHLVLESASQAGLPSALQRRR